MTVSGKDLDRVISAGPDPHPSVTLPWLVFVSGWGTLGFTHSYPRSSRASPPETTHRRLSRQQASAGDTAPVINLQGTQAVGLPAWD